MTPERINALLRKLDEGWTKPIATPPEFAEAAEVIRYLQSEFGKVKNAEVVAYLSPEGRLVYDTTHPQRYVPLIRRPE